MPEQNPQHPEQSGAASPKPNPNAPKNTAPPSTATPTPGASPSPKPPISVRVEQTKADKVLGQIAQALKEFWRKAQPVLQEKSIQALRASNRFTNHFLDNTWPKLSAQANAAIPANTKTKIEEQKAKIQPTLNTLKPIWEKGLLPIWQKVVVPLWLKGLALLRSRLPVTLAQELTDRFLTIAIISALVIVYWFFSLLTAGKPAVAKQPDFPKPVATPLVKRPVVPAKPSPKSAPKIVTQPSSIPSTSPTTQPAEPYLAPPEPVVIKPIPAKSTPVEPSLDMSEVKTQLTNAVASVDPDLVTSVQSLESNHRLQAKVGKTWFGLNSVAQDQVAQDLWERSQSFKFEQFELRDEGGTLIARSPVIGSKIVVFRRQEAPDAS